MPVSWQVEPMPMAKCLDFIYDTNWASDCAPVSLYLRILVCWAKETKFSQCRGIYMDRMYLKQTIERLEYERSIHDEKYSRNPAHTKCLPNFDIAIEKLKKELAKIESESVIQKIA